MEGTAFCRHAFAHFLHTRTYLSLSPISIYLSNFLPFGRQEQTLSQWRLEGWDHAGTSSFHMRWSPIWEAGQARAHFLGWNSEKALSAALKLTLHTRAHAFSTFSPFLHAFIPAWTDTCYCIRHREGEGENRQAGRLGHVSWLLSNLANFPNHHFHPLT